MSLIEEATKGLNRIYADIYLKRRYPDGSFDSSWIDITRWVITSGMSRIKYQLDSGDFDVGFFTASNINMRFDNTTGKFNDNTDPRSLWEAFETKHLSKIRIEAGYLDEDDVKSAAIPFEGTIDENSIKYNDKDVVSMTVLALDSIFKTVEVVAGSLSSSVLVSDAIFILCNRSEITDFINVTTGNINPEDDVIIDDPSAYNSVKLNEVLNELLFMSNSIMYIDSSNNLIIRDRDETEDVQKEFYINSESGYKDNIYDVKNINTGRHRVKNLWTWSGIALTAKSVDHHLKRFGTTRRNVNFASITNNTTRQEVLDALLALWQFPKQELIIETDYIPGVLDFYDMVTLDIRPRLTREDNIPIAGKAIAGSALSIDYATGLFIDVGLGFKIMAYEHDLRKATTIFKLRLKGTQLNDGWIDMLRSKQYAVTFTASATEDIDVSGEGINADQTKVEIVDSTGKTVQMDVTRPDINTIRLTAGSAITEIFNVNVVEVRL